MGIANWKEVARHRDGWRGETREALVFLDSEDTEEEEEKEDIICSS
jgi:hypothetical protein